MNKKINKMRSKGYECEYFYCAMKTFGTDCLGYPGDCVLMFFVSGGKDWNWNKKGIKRNEFHYNNTGIHSNNRSSIRSGNTSLQYEYIGNKRLSRSIGTTAPYYYIHGCDNLLCWGIYEAIKISNLIYDNVKCLQIRGICDMIAKYCAGDDLINIQNLFDTFDKQIQHYRYHKEFKKWKDYLFDYSVDHISDWSNE